jgi:hypothetical protein
MKLANATNNLSHRKDIHCIIPLIPPPLTPEQVQKISTRDFKWRSVPSDPANKNEVRVTVEVFSTDLPNAAERLCILMDEVSNIAAGQNIAENFNSVNQVILQVLKDSALETYRTAVDLAVIDNNSMINNKKLTKECRK